MFLIHRYSICSMKRLNRKQRRQQVKAEKKLDCLNTLQVKEDYPLHLGSRKMGGNILTGLINLENKGALKFIHLIVERNRQTV